MTNLIDRLIAPTAFGFTRVLAIKPPVDFLAGLTVPSPPVNLTTLGLLEKATYHPVDIGIVAGKPEVVGALVRLWLCTAETAVAQKARTVLIDFLSNETCDTTSIDDNLMWRRVFHDKDVYGSIFSLCSLKTVGQAGQLSKNQKTVAQGRLLDLIITLDSHSSPLRTSQLPDIERQYGVENGGLLDFAFLHMVDYRNDDLMLSTIIDTCTQYMKPSIREEDPPFSLIFLKKNGLHTLCTSYFLKPSPEQSSWLLGVSAAYLACYCSYYPKYLLDDAELTRSLLDRMVGTFTNVSMGNWLSGLVPKTHLKVLASLPRIMLLPGNTPTDPLPLNLIPSNAASEPVFDVLSEVLCGHPGIDDDEQAAARALYFVYLDEYPDFWTYVVKAADTVALTSVAIAAISLIERVILAQWKPLNEYPSTPLASGHCLPSEDWLSQHCNDGIALPKTGMEAIMTHQAAAESVLPYLLKPAQTFSNLVGGGRGDVESAAWKIAVAKHHVLISFYGKLREMADSPEKQDMVETVRRRIAQGPMGGSSQVGGSVETMEM